MCIYCAERYLQRPITTFARNERELSSSGSLHACSSFFLRIPKKLKKGLLPLIDFFTHSCITKRLNVCTDSNPMYAWGSQFNHGIEPHFVRVASKDTCTQVIIISHMTSINDLNRKKILTLSTWCQFKLTQFLFIIY